LPAAQKVQAAKVDAAQLPDWTCPEYLPASQAKQELIPVAGA